MNQDIAGQDSDVSDLVIEEKGTRKKNERERKKEEKKIDQFMKSISNLTSEEKIDALCKRNTDSYESIRTYKGSIQLLQRRIQVLEREKVQLQNEQSKSVLARSRLETLCRELQRQNKSIKDESLQKIREEEEKRKEMSNKFQTALNEVTQMMQQNTDKNLKLRDDNVEISLKFQKLCEQFKQREEEVMRLTKQMDLEKQLAEATVNRIQCELKAEKEIWNKEKIEQLKFSEEERLKLNSNIKNLEEHLAMYSTRYEEFETTITKSNKVFDSYNVEMSRLTKQVNKLENDCHSWQERWMQTQQQLNRALLDTKTLETGLLDRDRKLDKLSSLCRFIQEERTTYLKQLKENGIAPIVTVLPPVPPPAVPAPIIPELKSHHKMSKKEKELFKLKKQVNALETQLVGAVLHDIKNHDNLQNDTVAIQNQVSFIAENQLDDEKNCSIQLLEKLQFQSDVIIPKVPNSSVITSDQLTIESESKCEDIISEIPKSTMTNTIPVITQSISNTTDYLQVESKNEQNNIIPETQNSIQTNSEVTNFYSNTSEVTKDTTISNLSTTELTCELPDLSNSNICKTEVTNSGIDNSEVTNLKLNTSNVINTNIPNSEVTNTDVITLGLSKSTTNIDTSEKTLNINTSETVCASNQTLPEQFTFSDTSQAEAIQPTNQETKDEVSKLKAKGKHLRKKKK